MLRIVLVICAVVVAAIAANLALLSRAASSRDPVGRLSPVVAVVSPAPGRPAAKTAVRPSSSTTSSDTGKDEADGDRAGDDD